MGQRHKHADVIIAWAEGKDVQVWDHTINKWGDIPGTPTWREDREYRVKPPTKKYRVALFKDSFSGDTHTNTAETLNEAKRYEAVPNFVRWLTDWIEYEE